VRYPRALAGALVALVTAVLCAAAPTAQADPGADIVTRVSGLGPVQLVNFSPIDPAVLANCVTAGSHRIIPFSISADNVGFGNAVAGPVPPPPCNGCACGAVTNGIFKWSDRKCSWEVSDFVDFWVVGVTKTGTTGFLSSGTESSCVADSARWSPSAPASPRFSCLSGATQGVQVGWRLDLSSMACSFIVADNLPPTGEFRLVATTNSSATMQEERIDNNSTVMSFALRVGQLATPAPPAWRCDRAGLPGDHVSYLPSVTSSGPGRTNIFWTDGALRTNTVRNGFPPGGEPGTPPGVTLSSTPSAVSWGPGRDDVFARGSDNRLWHAWGNAVTVDRWDNPAGVSDMRSEPAAISWAPNRLDVFSINAVGSLQHTWWDGGGWYTEDKGHPPNVGLINKPSPVAQGVDAINVFAVGSDGRLWHKGWFGYWTDWEAAPNVAGVNGTPSTVSQGPGLVDTFWWNSANGISHISRSFGSWSAVQNFNPGPNGGTVISSPTAVSWGLGRLDVFWRMSDNNLTHLIGNGGVWSWDNAIPLSGDVLTSPAAVTWANGRLDVAFGTTSGELGLLSFF